MPESGVRTARWLLAVVLFLIVYGSLFPFRFEDAGIDSLAALRAGLPWARTTRSDIVANVLLYLPFGACLAWMLAPRIGAALALVAALLAGALLSTAIEVAQIYETRRVSSLADISFNSLGAAGGAALALALRAAGRSLGRHPLDRVLAHPIAAALVVLWVCYRLVPFAPVLGPGEWLEALAPLWRSPWLQPWATLEWLLPWLVVGQALTALSRRASGVRALLLVMLGVAAGLVVLSGKSLLPAEVLAMALALALTWTLDRQGEARAAGLLAFSVAALFIVDGLSPFNFQLGRDPMSWVPFSESLLRYRATSLPAMFERCFTYGALVWLLARSGRSALGATVLAGSLVLAVEVLQTWLPSRVADITDPLLVMAAGGLLALFEGRPAARGAGRPALR
ncbi:MAG: VanZ family protein [Steroidobacteraceae bacterium]|jgi:VanZ family protein|nr:VanZ family protein [Steroidobacteraceae bacterium]